MVKQDKVKEIKQVKEIEKIKTNAPTNKLQVNGLP